MIGSNVIDAGFTELAEMQCMIACDSRNAHIYQLMLAALDKYYCNDQIGN